MLNPLKVGRYFVNLHTQLTTNKLSPTEVWNMDETGLSLEHRPSKVLAAEGIRSVPGKTGNSRECVTILPCINAAGEKMPPLVIVKGKTERSLRSFNTHEGPPGSNGPSKKKAWMNDLIGIECSEVISSYEITPTYFSSPDHTGDNHESCVTNSQTLINFNDSYDITVTSDKDPFMSAAISDNDAAEILTSLTEVLNSSTMDTVVELDNSQWSGTWNDELDKIFFVKSSGKTPKKLKTGKIITSHRLLTSQEIINRKRKVGKTKDKGTREKTKKAKREEVKINKQKQKKEKKVRKN
ncbi:unnamed protein product [Mytilus coruscus]|uniref:DDE-1 domain-containing protein n=1 Tax=Mytilus coruscus TaxID=42192 RepID=A0A6J8A640_MYTCO|nr:unnamed protein product [Mytilus coruscus]